jgi:hypothetical protein
MQEEQDSRGTGRAAPSAADPDREWAGATGLADEPVPEDHGTLDAGIAGVMTAVTGHGARDAADAPSVLQADGFTDIWDAFTRLRDALGLPGTPGGTETAAEPAGSRQSGPVSAALLENAMAGARASAAWYRDSPEWQRITLVTYAARALLDAIRGAAGDYWSEISRDIRVRGFVRTVAARTCHTVSACAGALAARLEQAGDRQSAAWRAMSLLHRTAGTAANRVIGYQPPVRDAERIIVALNAGQQVPPGLIRQAAPRQAADTSPAALAALSFPAPVSQAATTAPGSARRRAATGTDRHLGGPRH